MTLLSCILSKFYIKPQLARQWLMVPCVVSYRNSTSNHNYFFVFMLVRCVVSYRNSTSNHNWVQQRYLDWSLYLIEILHQTTTPLVLALSPLALYLIEILHQTTTYRRRVCKCVCCILSKFYIKPQRVNPAHGYSRSCILSKFYIKPQQLLAALLTARSCILSKFYIKPQLKLLPLVCLIVVSYRNSTSNHNIRRPRLLVRQLYLIEILHQTTTVLLTFFPVVRLYLIEILHQTTTLKVQESIERKLYLIEILHQTTTHE